MRFRAEQHLRRQRDFREAREKGRRQDCGAFMLWWYRRPAEAAVGGIALSAPIVGPRVGVIASTAAVGHAVRRNRAKRRLREIFRAQQNLVPPGCDLLLIARAAATDRPIPELAQKFSDACRQIAAASKPSSSPTS